MSTSAKDKTSIPESLLSKLFDASGTKSGGTKGFILTYVNSDGDTSIITRTENNCILLSLKKTLELFVDQDGMSLKD